MIDLSRTGIKYIIGTIKVFKIWTSENFSKIKTPKRLSFHSFIIII